MDTPYCYNSSREIEVTWREFMASTTAEQGQVFIGPGLSPFRRIATIVAVLGVIAFVLWIALHQGASAIGSTIVAIALITGFVIYLRIIAPVPFTITLDPPAPLQRIRNVELFV